MMCFKCEKKTCILSKKEKHSVCKCTNCPRGRIIIKQRKNDGHSYLACKNSNLCTTTVKLPTGVTHVVFPEKD